MVNEQFISAAFQSFTATSNHCAFQAETNGRSCTSGCARDGNISPTASPFVSKQGASPVALVSAWRSHSPALLAFGSDSFAELLSAIVVLVQFVPRVTLRPIEAARLCSILLFVLAGVVVLTSAAALSFGMRPEVSPSGIAITAGSLDHACISSGKAPKCSQSQRWCFEGRCGSISDMCLSGGYNSSRPSRKCPSAYLVDRPRCGSCRDTHSLD